MNTIYSQGKKLSISKLQRIMKEDALKEHQEFITKEYVLERISGDHCMCKGKGRFELLSKKHPTVIAGGKRYMICMKCNGTSHL